MSFKQQVYAVLSVLLVACSEPSGSEFVGKWHHSPNTIEFVRNGDSFLFVDSGNKYPATLAKDGTLQAATPFGPMVFSYSKDSDSVFALGSEFKRVSK